MDIGLGTGVRDNLLFAHWVSPDGTALLGTTPKSFFYYSERETTTANSRSIA